MNTMAESLTDEDHRWNTVVQRDRSAADDFLYAVKTTGVFCRPGCASRLPRRENVEFFDSCADAERAGYRPCRRCRPGETSPDERLAQTVIRACRRIETAEKAPTLAELATEAGLSPWHFQRVFRERVGLTPKQYARSHQLGRLRDSLHTERSVTEATYASGFGSSSRAHEGARERLAMTPSSYRKGAAGMTIRYGVTACDLGRVGVAVTEHGICAIELGDDAHSVVERLRASFPKARLEEAGAEFADLLDRVVALIETPASGIELPLDIRGTAFQERVWEALRRIPSGATASYAEIARRIGHPRAVRAVAGACAANRLAVAVPCHRAVRSDGGLGGYRWGMARKHDLLGREARTSADGNPAGEDTGQASVVEELGRNEDEFATSAARRRLEDTDW